MTDFRQFLQSELIRRCRSNANYSLRAFARTLNVSPSALSAMLNNKRTITPTTKKKFGLALGLNPRELAMFLEDSKSEVFRDQYKQFQQITMDSFSIIADWYHYAILELIRVKGFKTDLNWIARTLNISKSETNIAIERLQRIGLLEISRDGTWVDRSDHGNATNIDGDLTSVAARRLQKQILEMSIKALEEIPVELRSHTSMTLAINPGDLSKAKDKITKFRRELAQMLESNNEPTQVYHLNITLYPITKI